MKYSTIPRVSARPRRTANPYIGIEAPKLAKAAPAAVTRHYPCAYCRKAPGATREFRNSAPDETTMYSKQNGGKNKLTPGQAAFGHQSIRQTRNPEGVAGKNGRVR